MTSGLVIRDATPDDLYATAQIIAAESGGSVTEWAERFAQVLADPARLFLVAVLEGKVVAFGQARRVEPREGGPPDGWYLSGVTVVDGYRRRGLASALTEARLARLQDAEAVHYAAEPDNLATIRLHERFGFLRVGETRLPGSDVSLLLFRRPMDAPIGGRSGHEEVPFLLTGPGAVGRVG